MKQTLLNDLELSLFCENLSMMLGAGIPSSEALELLCEDMEPGPFQEGVRRVLDCLEETHSLPGALRAAGCFPSYLSDMVEVGEIAGRTEQVLKRLAVYYEGQDALQKKLRSAVVYPTVMLVLMTAVMLFLVFEVLPVFSGVYAQLAGDLTGSSVGYMSVAKGVAWAVLVITLVLAVLLLVGLQMMKRPRGLQRLAALAQRLPLTKGVAYQVSLARFTSALSTFLASGVDTDRAMAVSSEMVDHPLLRAKLTRCRERMETGEGLAQAIYAEKVFPSLYARMLVSGFQSGSGEESLARLTRLFAEESDRQIDGALSTVEPGLAAFLTLSVGVILLAVMLPLIGIMGAIG